LPLLLGALSHRIARWVSRTIVRPYRRRKDLAGGSYSKPFADGGLRSLVGAVSADALQPCRRTVAGLVAQYVQGRFDLLGSGWVQVRHGMHCRGLEGTRYDAAGNGVDGHDRDRLDQLINPSNRQASVEIGQMILPHATDEEQTGGYVPIDWQLDFKSGYRWSERTWYRCVDTDPAQGADIKVPWELGRMQHLVQFAWAYALAGEDREGFLPPEAYLSSFRNQVLDFIARNPPRFGVQWACTMDVGIRVSNWLIAYDLFKAFGATFDESFERVLCRSVHEHGRHIVRNLEWGTRLRHNHYLANVVGLLFAAAFLPATPETDTWLAFAIEELIHEVGSQFHPEGSNFEGSICYHCLSAEMVVYATALVFGLPAERLAAVKRVGLARALRHCGVDAFLVRSYRQTAGGGPSRSTSPASAPSPFPPWYIERLERMAEFTMHATKPNGRVPQVGDNDSGRFVKAMPAGETMSVDEAKHNFANLADWLPPDGMEVYWQEDHLSHRHLVSAIDALCSREDFASVRSGDDVDGWLVRALAGGVQAHRGLPASAPCAAEGGRIGSVRELRELEQRLQQSEQHGRRITVFDFGDNHGGRVPVTEGLRTYAYPAFGLYTLRSERLFMCIRCGPIGRNGQGGHSHNDQLSIELSVDGVDWIADPGTYLYTASPECRNRYRSVQAHFAPKAGLREPVPLDRGLFVLPDLTRATTVFFGPEGFAGTHDGYGKPTYRLVRIESFSVSILDCFPHETGIRGDDRVTLTTRSNSPIAFSPGYGIVRRQ